MTQWYDGMMAQWYNGTKAQWHNGTIVQWYKTTEMYDTKTGVRHLPETYVETAESRDTMISMHNFT